MGGVTAARRRLWFLSVAGQRRGWGCGVVMTWKMERGCRDCDTAKRNGYACGTCCMSCRVPDTFRACRTHSERAGHIQSVQDTFRACRTHSERAGHIQSVHSVPVHYSACRRLWSTSASRTACLWLADRPTPKHCGFQDVCEFDVVCF